jgi:PAS domain S-box-containing protein
LLPGARRSDNAADRPVKLRAHLTTLAIGAMAPLVAVVMAAGIFIVRHERATIERDAVGRTRAAMSAIDAELRGVISGMDALATSTHLKEDNLRAFYDESRRIVASQRYWANVGLTSPAKVQLFDTVLPFGESRQPGDEEMLDASIHTRRLTIGNVAAGPAIGVPVIRVRMPIIREGALDYVLSVAVKLDLFDEVLRAQQLPADWVISLSDRNRGFVARIPPRPPGDPMSSSFREAVARAPEGFFFGETVEGVETYTPYVTSAFSGWVLGIAVPADVINAGGFRFAAILMAGLAIALAVAWWAARRMATRIARPIGALAATTTAIERGGELMLPAPGRIDEIVRLHHALRLAVDSVRERQQLLEARDVELSAAVGEFRTLFDTAPIGVAIARDRACRHIEVNRELCRIFGTAREGNVPLVIDPLQPQPYRMNENGREIPLERRPMQLAAGDGAVSTARELDIVRVDGQTLKVVAYAVPILDTAGIPRGSFGAFVDVTERRRAEAERDALLVREQDARAAAETANRAKDEFLAMLGHELRNPLGAIAGALSVLGLRDAAPPVAERARAVIGRQVQHLSRLVDDLLDVSRVTTGKIRLDRRPLDFGALVASTMATWRAAGRFRDHEVSVDTAPVWIDGDETRIEQIVANLVGNALKYTPGGGHIHVRVGLEGDDAVLEVADTGSGLPADLLGKVFDLFVQGDRPLDRAQGGLGIGLTLVKALAVLHGGSVDARSEGQGHGSVFTVRLPHVAAPAEPKRSPPSSEPAPVRRRILLVEDNDDAREMLRVALTHAGHDVHEAIDGPSGLKAAVDLRPDIAFIDVGLPGLDGYEIARQLRSRPECRHIYLVALTGYGQPEDRRRAEDAGFDEHLVKPVDPHGLAPVLARSGNGAHARI